MHRTDVHVPRLFHLVILVPQVSCSKLASGHFGISSSVVGDGGCFRNSIYSIDKKQDAYPE